MIRILIVDDEPRQRRGMEQLIHLLYANVEVISLRNGEQALEEMRKKPVQIIISDIRMPHMTGLELAEKAHELNAETLIILVSAYAEFDYAHRAIELGVFSYLLKPIQPQAVQKVLDRALHYCEQLCSNRLQAQIKDDRLRNALSLYQQHLLYLWLTDELAQEQWNEIAQHIPMGVGGRLIRMLLPKGDGAMMPCYSPKEWPEISENMGYWLEREFAPTRTVSAVSVEDPYTRTFAIFSHDDPLSALLGFQKQSKTDYGFVPTLLVSGYHSSLDRQVRMAQKELNEAAALLFYHQPGALIIYDQSQTPLNTLPTCSKQVWEQIEQATLSGNTVDAENRIEDVLVNFKTTSPVPGLLKDSVVSLMMKLQRCIMDAFSAADQQAFIDEILALRDEASFFSLTAEVKAVIGRLCAYCEASRMEDSPISHSLRYIEEHYMDNISLQWIAQSCHYSVSYFSTLFKTQTGESFVAYLNNLRLKKACQLLSTTNQKTGDIALQVGFGDPKYFDRLFTRQYGMSAQTYRKSLRRVE